MNDISEALSLITRCVRMARVPIVSTRVDDHGLAYHGCAYGDEGVTFAWGVRLEEPSEPTGPTACLIFIEFGVTVCGGGDAPDLYPVIEIAFAAAEKSWRAKLRTDGLGDSAVHDAAIRIGIPMDGPDGIVIPLADKAAGRAVETLVNFGCDYL